jgi:hypothetical protein
MENHLRGTPESASTATWQVAIDALRLLYSQSKCREIARAGTGDILNEQARAAVLFQEFRTHLAAISSDDGMTSEFLKNGAGLEAKNLDTQRLIAFLRRWPLPATYWKRAAEQFPMVHTSSTENGEEAAPSPLVRVIASLDDAPWVSPQLLRPQLLYSLKFTIRGIGWRAGTERLRLDLVSTCPSTEYSISDFALPKPSCVKDSEYDGELTGQMSFRSAQSVLSGELSFVVRCAFELSDGGYAEVPVIGHNQLDFRVVSPDGTGMMSGYRRLDQHLVALVNRLLESNPEVRGELTELVPVFDALTCLLGVYAQGAVFKKTRTLKEGEFQSAVIRDMRLRLGEEVQEHPSQAGGNTDVRYRGVVIELKVERNNGDRKHIAQKYAPQSIQYESVEARQVSVVMVLDLTAKDDPPGDIRNDVLLVDVPTHGGSDSTKPHPSKAFIFVVNGNIRDPSDYSK